MAAIKLVIDNVRSAYNVGSMFRTADALGIEELIICGISPYPEISADSRPPQVIARNLRQIAKTALDAQRHVAFRYFDTTVSALTELRGSGHRLYGLEQTDSATALADFKPDFPCALVVGHEIRGVSPHILSLCDDMVEIPQVGHKESLNVAVATGIALYALTNRPR